MKSIWKSMVLSAVGVLLVAGCAAPPAPGAPAAPAVPVATTAPVAVANDLSGRKVKVVTTTGQTADIARNVGGDRVEVQSLMGAGVDPHLYKPTASDVDKLTGADIIFYNGLELEGRMTDLFVKMVRNGKPTFPVSEGIDESKLAEPSEFEGKYDPHVWFEVPLWQDAVRSVNTALGNLDPTSKDLYQKNTDAYLKQLDELNTYTKDQIATIPENSRVLITAHDAFGYFGRAYGMEVRGLQGTSTATEAGAGDVQDLATFICERGVKAIFVESSVPQATIQAVQEAAKAKGCEVGIGGELFSDAMGNEGTPEGTYVGMLRYNVDTITKALK